MDNPVKTKSPDAVTSVSPPPDAVTSVDRIALLREGQTTRNPKAGDQKTGNQKTAENSQPNSDRKLDLTPSIYPNSSIAERSVSNNKAKPEPNNKCPPESELGQNGVVNTKANGDITVTHKGRGPADNYSRTYRDDPDSSQCKEKSFHIINPNRTSTWKYSDGRTTIEYPQTGETKTTFDRLAHSVVKVETWNPKTQERHDNFIDGTVANIFLAGPNPRAEIIESYGKTTIKTTKYPNDSLKVENYTNGQEIGGSFRQPTKDGGYSETGWGPTSHDNYSEKYDPHSGETTRTDKDVTKTLYPNGKQTIISKDQTVQINPDGSEHHFGKENFDKPAWDYNNAEVRSAQKEMFAAAAERMDSSALAAFEKDATDFKSRAPKSKIPPDEVARTYKNITALLNSQPDASGVGVKDEDRGLLAASLMHEAGHPEDIKQGVNNTCNVTVAYRESLTKNPAAVTGFITEIALKSAATAPDGSKVTVDQQSLIPGAEEINFPSDPGQRSFATQVANVAFVNLAVQARGESYTQQPFPTSYNGQTDTAERELDNPDPKKGHVIDTQPTITYNEISKLSAIFTGDDSPHVIGFNNMSPRATSVDTRDQLENQLKMLQNQGKLPVILEVDSNHFPIQAMGSEKKGFGAHVITVDKVSGDRVHINNQWNPSDNKWVTIDDLFDNMSGKRVDK